MQFYLYLQFFMHAHWSCVIMQYSLSYWQYYADSVKNISSPKQYQTSLDSWIFMRWDGLLPYKEVY